MSLAVAALLTGNASASTMYDRFQAMEEEMKKLQDEVAQLKSQDNADADESDEEESDAVALNDEGDDEDEDTDEEDADADDSEGDDEEDDEDDEMSFEEETEESLEYFDKTLSQINKNTAGNHLKFGVDFRTSVDNLQYKMAGENAQGEDTQGNDALLSNRLWINMNWAATENISFTGQLAYNKFYGARSGFTGQIAGFETFDWITNENPYDDVVRVRSAYFFYRNDTFLGTDIPWTFSIGRRPSTNGHLVNLRDDDPAASPMGHTINVEFDGLSSKFSFENLTGISGMYVKFCAGRGGTNAGPKFFSVNPASGSPNVIQGQYASTNDYPDIDLGGFIFVPYDDGQYSIGTQYYYAANLIDASIVRNGSGDLIFQGLAPVGGMHSVTANFKIDGIGNEWSDFLDETTLFISGATSITNPDAGKEMLGSADRETGYSYWAGLQTPTFSDNGRFGLEYNHGDQYWRSITYAEDTMAGSKLAARGDAYEAYWTESLIDGILSMQLRYTFIDYEYTGSNGFFGSATGRSDKITDIQAAAAAGDLESIGRAQSIVDTAQDIRFYIRYRY